MSRSITYFVLFAAAGLNLITPFVQPWRNGLVVNLIAGVMLLFVLWSTWQRFRREDERKVLDLLKRKPGLYLAQISDETGMSISGAIVTTFRLEQAGKLVSEWQDGPEPRKRLYSIA